MSKSKFDPVECPHCHETVYPQDQRVYQAHSFVVTRPKTATWRGPSYGGSASMTHSTLHVQCARDRMKELGITGGTGILSPDYVEPPPPANPPEPQTKPAWHSGSLINRKIHCTQGLTRVAALRNVENDVSRLARSLAKMTSGTTQYKRKLEELAKVRAEKVRAREAWEDHQATCPDCVGVKI